MTPEMKTYIDGLTHMQLAEKWRFAPPGHVLFTGDTFDYFKYVFFSKGGMTPEISKSIGWERQEG